MISTKCANNPIRDLNSNQVGYFIQQVGMSAASFGVSQADVQAAGQALTKL